MSSPLEVAATLAATHQHFIFFDGSRAPSGAGRSYIFAEPQQILTQSSGRYHLDGAEIEPLEALSILDDSTLPVAGMLGFEFAWELDDLRVKPHVSQTPNLWVATFGRWAAYDHARDRWLGPAEFETHPVQQSSSRLRNARLSISDREYERRVERARRAIFEGEVFEVNYTERFEGEWTGSGWALYEALRRRSTGAYFGFLRCQDFELASVSPELFLEFEGFRVVARPIKGTAPMADDTEADERVREALLQSEKDRAENVMIVDLMRNDLTRFCTPGTVEATELCALESFAGVHHLVSTVEGELRPGVSRLEAFVSAFPPGSITGAPKPRSIEVIAELEENARGPYTGSLFFEADGRLVSNVLIRSATLQEGIAEYGAGGAVVSDSEPESERKEAYTKAASFLALGDEE